MYFLMEPVTMTFTRGDMSNNTQGFFYFFIFCLNKDGGDLLQDRNLGDAAL